MKASLRAALEKEGSTYKNANNVTPPPTSDKENVDIALSGVPMDYDGLGMSTTTHQALGKAIAYGIMLKKLSKNDLIDVRQDEVTRALIEKEKGPRWPDTFNNLTLEFCNRWKNIRWRLQIQVAEICQKEEMKK